MVTAQQIFNNAMDLMDKRSTTGTIDTTKTQRYTVRAPSIISIAQATLARDGDLYSSYEFYHSNFGNLLGVRLGEVTDYIGVETIFESSEVGYAYYFDVDGGIDGIVFFEDYTSDWNTLVSVDLSTVTDVTAFKGVLFPTSGATKSRVRFTGTSFYRILNVALFSEPFVYDQIPVYRAWVEYVMPDDFKSVNQIIKKSPIQSYQKDSYYTWEGRNRLYIDYNYDGQVKVIYVPIPIPITTLSQELEIDDTASTNCLVYFLAAHLLLTEDPEIASFYNGMYLEAKNAMKQKRPNAIENIEDIFLEDGGYDYWL